jgi:hypothetical protein
VSKLLQVAGWVIVGLVVVTAASPALVKLAHASIPLIVTIAVVTVIVRVTWFLTR